MADVIRKLNDEGLHAFEQHLRDLRDGKKLETPFHMLTDPRYSEPLNAELAVEQREFQTRYAMGEYLTDVLEGTEIQPLLGDVGFWSWLALYWFDQLCPVKADGSRKPRQIYNYILSSNYNHRPRHAVLTTWFLVDRYGETALFLLSKPLHERGDLLEQLAARQYLIGCKGVIEAASRLYYDPGRKTFKRGSASTKRKGNIRRFISYLQQLDLTYDLYTLQGQDIIRMLPDEYTGFLK